MVELADLNEQSMEHSPQKDGLPEAPLSPDKRKRGQEEQKIHQEEPQLISSTKQGEISIASGDKLMFNQLLEVVKANFKNSATYMQLFQAHGTLAMPPRFGDEDENQRTYQPWKQDEFGYLYQGEVNSKGEPCGQGTKIDPQKYIFIGNFLNGERHGPYIHFYGQGKVEGQCQNDNYTGLEKTVFLDGSCKEKTYAKKTKIQSVPGEIMDDPEGGDQKNGIDMAHLFQNIEDILNKFRETPVMHQVIAKHGSIELPPAPRVLMVDRVPREFQMLKEQQLGGRFYQGEVNKEDGEPDGLGILVDPSKSMHVGYFRNGERHGPYIHFFLNGWVKGTCDYDNYVGKEETTYMDGTTKVIDYDKETYYQQSRCTLF